MVYGANHRTGQLGEIGPPRPLKLQEQLVLFIGDRPVVPALAPSMGEKVHSLYYLLVTDLWSQHWPHGGKSPQLVKTIVF